MNGVCRINPIFVLLAACVAVYAAAVFYVFYKCWRSTLKFRAAEKISVITAEPEISLSQTSEAPTDTHPATDEFCAFLDASDGRIEKEKLLEKLDRILSHYPDLNVPDLPTDGTRSQNRML